LCWHSDALHKLFFLNKRNCRYNEKKVLTVMINNATNINKIVFVPVPRQYLDF